jgi:hypothetical protein
VLIVPEPLRSAEQFLGGLFGHIQLRAVLGVSRASPDEIAAAVRYAVRAFLAAHAPS